MAEGIIKKIKKGYKKWPVNLKIKRNKKNRYQNVSEKEKEKIKECMKECNKNWYDKPKKDKPKLKE